MAGGVEDDARRCGEGEGVTAEPPPRPSPRPCSISFRRLAVSEHQSPEADGATASPSGASPSRDRASMSTDGPRHLGTPSAGRGRGTTSRSGDLRLGMEFRHPRTEPFRLRTAPHRLGTPAAGRRRSNDISFRASPSRDEASTPRTEPFRSRTVARRPGTSAAGWGWSDEISFRGSPSRAGASPSTDGIAPSTDGTSLSAAAGRRKGTERQRLPASLRHLRREPFRLRPFPDAGTL